VIKPELAEAWLCRGNVFIELKRYDEALVAYDKAVTIKPEFAEAWLGRGNVFRELKGYDEALAVYDKAVAIKPELAEAWFGRGNVFFQLGRYDEALVAYDKAVAIKPNLKYAKGARLLTKMYLSDWSDLNIECEHLISVMQDGVLAAYPFVMLAIP